MTIPTKTVKKWKSLIEHGKTEEVAIKAGMPYIKLYRRLKTKRCSVEEFKTLSSVFGEIERENKKLIETAQLTETE
jgi:hypothetical protein